MYIAPPPTMQRELVEEVNKFPLAFTGMSTMDSAGVSFALGMERAYRWMDEFVGAVGGSQTTALGQAMDRGESIIPSRTTPSITLEQPRETVLGAIPDLRDTMRDYDILSAEQQREEFPADGLSYDKPRSRAEASFRQKMQQQRNKIAALQGAMPSDLLSLGVQFGADMVSTLVSPELALNLLAPPSRAFQAATAVGRLATVAKSRAWGAATARGLIDGAVLGAAYEAAYAIPEFQADLDFDWTEAAWNIAINAGFNMLAELGGNALKRAELSALDKELAKAGAASNELDRLAIAAERAQKEAELDRELELAVERNRLSDMQFFEGEVLKAASDYVAGKLELGDVLNINTLNKVAMLGRQLDLTNYIELARGSKVLRGWLNTIAGINEVTAIGTPRWQNMVSDLNNYLSKAAKAVSESADSLVQKKRAIDRLAQERARFIAALEGVGGVQGLDDMMHIPTLTQTSAFVAETAEEAIARAAKQTKGYPEQFIQVLQDVKRTPNSDKLLAKARAGKLSQQDINEFIDRRIAEQLDATRVQFTERAQAVIDDLIKEEFEQEQARAQRRMLAEEITANTLLHKELGDAIDEIGVATQGIETVLSSLDANEAAMFRSDIVGILQDMQAAVDIINKTIGCAT